MTPEAVLRSTPEALRAAGLSQGKARYLLALSEAVASDSLALEGIDALPDEAVIDALTQVKGIGVWTAQMFLMFRLGRGDVLPTNDLGIQKGLQRAHGLRKPAAPGYVRKAGVRWAPHRSTACPLSIGGARSAAARAVSRAAGWLHALPGGYARLRWWPCLCAKRGKERGNAGEK